MMAYYLMQTEMDAYTDRKLYTDLQYRKINLMLSEKIQYCVIPCRFREFYPMKDIGKNACVQSNSLFLY